MNIRWRPASSVRARLTLWNMLTFAIVLLSLGVGFRFLAEQYLLNALDRDMKLQAQRFQDKHRVEMLIVNTNLPGKPGAASGSVGKDTLLRFVPAPETFHITSTQIKQIKQSKQINAQVRIVTGGDASVNTIGGAPNVTSAAQFMDMDKSGAFLYRSFDLQGKPLSPPLPKLPFDLPLLNGLTAPTTATQQKQLEEYRPWDRTSFNCAARGEERLAAVNWEGSQWRVLAVPLREFRAGEASAIVGVAQIAAPLSQVYRDIAGLTRVLLLVLPFALLIAAAAGIFLTDRALRPVKALAKAATEIRAEQLSCRLPVSGADEFDALASAFNHALDRVQAAFAEREHAMEQLRRFTADASHELRTPLTTIKANAGVALKEAEPSEEHLHALRQIDRAADRMSDLVRDLLLLARSEAGQSTLAHRPLLLEDVAREAINATTFDGQPSICLDVRDANLMVCGDDNHLIRLLLNLLENAVRYTPRDGQVRLSVERQSADAIIVVQDTGSGIAPEHLPHVGERFYRADAGRSRRQGGAGLGLAICRSIAAQHSGTLSLDSAPGCGTTVTVRLPLYIGGSE